MTNKPIDPNEEPTPTPPTDPNVEPEPIETDSNSQPVEGEEEAKPE